MKKIDLNIILEDTFIRQSEQIIKILDGIPKMIKSKTKIILEQYFC